MPVKHVAYRNYAEYLNHPEFKKVRSMAFERAQGVCEQCRMRPATEIHHVAYPPWGTFEKTPEYLKALCHDCHCAIHHKEK